MRVELVVTDGPMKSRQFVFEKADCFLFGKSAEAHASLPDDPYVSRQHFMLEITPARSKLADLDSTNGTYINKIRYGAPFKKLLPGTTQAPDNATERLLQNGDSISVGKTTLLFHMDDICVKCQCIIPQGQRAASQVAENVFLCEHCRKSEQRPSPVPASGAPAVHTLVLSEAPDYSMNAKGEVKITVLETASTVIQAVPGSPHIPGYSITHELGRGGMGVVYKAVEDASGRIVAIKTMLPQIAAHALSVQQFQRETKVLGQLRHPNITAILNHGKVGQIFYFVLEFVDGMDLARHLSQNGGHLPLKHAAPLMLQTLDGLAHVHASGTVHRDLKPENILLEQTPGGLVAKVADFGLAKSFEDAGLTMGMLTMPGQACGTPVYWPREHITQYRYLNPPTDVFSIAAVFYKMLTGEYVRPGLRVMLDDHKKRNLQIGLPHYTRVIMAEKVRPLRSALPTLPPRVADVFDKALAEPELPRRPNEDDDAHATRSLAELKTHRFPDAAAFRDSLKAALAASGL